MFSPRIKRGLFGLEFLNSIATTFYFYYLFFFMQARYGFTSVQNLLLASGIGCTYALSAVLGGRVGQRKGCFFAVKTGFAIMGASVLIGFYATDLWMHLLLTGTCTLGMCLTWPNLEAGVTENEPPGRVRSMVGIYNLVWAVGGSLAYFCGGAMLEKIGLRSIFLIPAAIHFSQFCWALRLQKEANSPDPRSAQIALDNLPEDQAEELRRTSLRPETFRSLAWVANPFAYVAINTAVPVIPNIAKKLALTPMLAGFFCSVWFFARAAAFLVLWKWPGWHYRFRWLIAAYVGIAIGFLMLQTATQFWLLLPAQILFGASLGLIYYSSLYYSMDNSDTKGEHGGLHEAAIGAGNCLGPLISASVIHLAPTHPENGAYAVAAALAAGLLWIFVLAAKGKPKTRGTS